MATDKQIESAHSAKRMPAADNQSGTRPQPKIRIKGEPPVQVPGKFQPH
jgi:hypothetical protein